MLTGLPALLHQLFIPSAGATTVPATMIADPGWLREQVLLRGRSWPTTDRHVLATLWWFSASHHLVTPTVTTLLLTGTAASPALPDLVLHHCSDGTITGAHSTAVLGTDLDTVAAGLRAASELVIDIVSELTSHGVRPLWALAADSLADRLLLVGEATGRRAEARALAARLSAGIGAPMLLPRFIDVMTVHGRSRCFVQRVSCCLLYRVPGQQLCTTCPRRSRADRLRLLATAAGPDQEPDGWGPDAFSI